MKTSLSKFQQIFHLAAILNFQFFFKNAKHKNACIINRARESDFDETFYPQGTSFVKLTQFSKNFCPAKNGGHFEFSNFSQKSQNTKMLVLEKTCQIERFRPNF